MSDPFDDRLRERLIALERSIEAAKVPVTTRRGASRTAGRAVLATVVLLLVAAVGAAAGQVIRDGVTGHDGIFDRSQVLHCSRIRNMVPSEAAPLLDALGYRVTWQLEGFPGGSRQTTTAPRAGYISTGFAKGRDLVFVVEYTEMARGEPCPD